MTEQETFDIVTKHLYTQGKQAITEDKRLCRYRAFDGLKCAAGCLIPDEEYSPKMESVNVTELPKIFSVLKEHNIQLVRRLQVVHDSYGSYKKSYTWKEYLDKKLATVADEWSLQFTAPTQGDIL